jgi:hypothetical protein
VEPKPYVGPDTEAALLEAAEMGAQGCAIPISYEHNEVECFCVGAALV